MPWRATDEGAERMRIETALDIEKRTVVVTIHTEKKAFKMIYELDKVVDKLDAISSNWFMQKSLELVGFKVEVEAEPGPPSAQPR